MKNERPAYKLMDYTYLRLVNTILNYGFNQQRRNSMCRSLVGGHLTLTHVHEAFPLLLSREIKYKGVFGELAAMVRGPKHIDDFKKWGCNYWDQFANKDGSLNVDYGNAWRKPVDQLANAMELLKTDPYSRRILVNGWVPENLDDLTLPCCHFAYQYVCLGDYLNIIWYQRSADLMVGVPSDVVLAALMLIGGAKVSGLKAGTIRMFFGDAHIYQEHLDTAAQMVEERLDWSSQLTLEDYPKYDLHNMDLLNFEPSMVSIRDYNTDLCSNYTFKCIK